MFKVSGQGQVPLPIELHEMRRCKNIAVERAIATIETQGQARVVEPQTLEVPYEEQEGSELH